MQGGWGGGLMAQPGMWLNVSGWPPCFTHSKHGFQLCAVQRVTAAFCACHSRAAPYLIPTLQTPDSHTGLSELGLH